MRVCSALLRRVLPIVGLAFVCTAVFSPIGIAQDTAAPESAATPSTNDLPPLPLSPIEKAQQDKTALPLSLTEVTKMALQNNLDIAIQDTNERAGRLSLVERHAAYDPTLTAGANTGTSRRPNTNVFQRSETGIFSESRSASWNARFSLPVKTGGTFTANFSTSRSDVNSIEAAFNPSYSSSFTMAFSQPLMRNLRIDSNRANIRVANLDLAITDTQFKENVTSTISRVQEQYWDLVAAIQSYQISRNSVRLGQITLRDNIRKVEVGTLAPIGITEARADLARRELDLITAEENILRQENALRQLLSNDRKSPIWSQVIVPTDTPAFAEYKIDLATAIDTAIRNRTELERYELQLRQADTQLQLARNNRKWQWDINAQFGKSAAAGPQAYRVAIDPVTGAVIRIPQTPNEFVGGALRSYAIWFTEPIYNWQLSISLDIPIRGRASDARIAQQEIQKQRILMNRRGQEQTIQVEIRNAVQRLETNKKQLETATISRQLSQEQLDGEEKRFQAGLSENFRVLERQNQLAQAENTELQRLIDYRKSVIALQRSMNTLLEFSDIELARGSSVRVPDLY
ncbi:MAG TPA: TolC family protein [Acidobacteriota bacterium]|nr:TolC family protein [Acidobacteriota bacterium]